MKVMSISDEGYATNVFDIYVLLILISTIFNISVMYYSIKLERKTE